MGARPDGNPIALTGAILRIFEVRAKPGCVAALKRKFSSTSVAVVQGAPGNLGHLFGQNLASGEDKLVFISLWKDLATIQAAFGADWEQPLLPEGYDALIERCSVRHVEVDGRIG